jgi:4,4'-diaponeurosporenoate glycosyltransferase
VSAVTILLIVPGLAVGIWLLAQIPLLRRPAKVHDAIVSIIVPTGASASPLPTLLDSLEGLDPAPVEIILVDGGTNDAVGEIARSHGAHLVTAPEPPVGWLAKPWACNVGASGAIGTHLLFLDPDTSLMPDALGRLVAEHSAHDGLVSVEPMLGTDRPHEELVAICAVVTMMGTGAFTPRAAGRSTAAFGPCLFTSADDYWSVGGHVAVAGEMLDDVRLGQRYRQAGRPVTCFGGGATVSSGTDGGFGELVAGWSTRLVPRALTTRRVIALGVTLWLVALAAVSLSFLAEVRQWLDGDEFPFAALLLYAVAAGEVRWMTRRIGTFRRWTAVVFSLPLLAFLVMLGRSCLEAFRRRSLRRRGRRVTVPPRG